MPDVVDTIHLAHDALADARPDPPPIRPFIGAAFRGDADDALRVMGIGINAYSAKGERPKPDEWADGFKNGCWNYERRVLADLARIGNGLADAPAFAGLRFADLDSIYLTNIVKRWIPDGQKAADIEPEWFDEGRPILRAELGALHHAGRLPHVVVVVGDRPWPYVYPEFQTARWSASFEPVPESDRLRHHLNLVSVRANGGTRPLLLVKIRHSSAAHWKRGITPDALLSNDTLRRLAGLETQGPGGG